MDSQTFNDAFFHHVISYLANFTSALCGMQSFWNIGYTTINLKIRKLEASAYIMQAGMTRAHIQCN